MGCPMSLPAFIRKILDSHSPLVEGVAPAARLDADAETLYRCIRTETCAVLAAQDSIFAYRMGNSVVMSLPQMQLSDYGDPRLVLSIVSIWAGASDPHTHNSHVLGIILTGSGWLDWWDVDGAQHRVELRPGDRLVVPRNVRHHLNTKSHIVVANVEIGDGEDLYYQRNLY